jgi:Cof subfamily protein (haloacid dehalogenase superfamily)
MNGVRLIACDLDGTLLDEHKQLPPELPALIVRLHARGVVFCPASGRQYHTIREQFAPLGASIPVIAENGAYVVFDGRELYSASLAADDVRAVLDAARSLKPRGADIGIVLCGKRAAYIERLDEPFVAQVAPYYLRLERVASLDAVLDAARDEILKIAVYDFESPEPNLYPRLRAFADRLQVVVSGSNWLDVMPAGIHKGAGLRALQDALALGRHQTAAFGDHLNDLELLAGAEHSYAMANAHPALRERARHIAAANSENGVVRAIEAMLAA